MQQGGPARRAKAAASRCVTSLLARQPSPVAVVGRRPHGDQLVVEHPLVALHHQLVRPRNQLNLGRMMQGSTVSTYEQEEESLLGAGTRSRTSEHQAACPCGSTGGVVCQAAPCTLKAGCSNAGSPRWPGRTVWRCRGRTGSLEGRGAEGLGSGLVLNWGRVGQGREASGCPAPCVFCLAGRQ